MKEHLAEVDRAEERDGKKSVGFQIRREEETGHLENLVSKWAQKFEFSRFFYHQFG